MAFPQFHVLLWNFGRDPGVTAQQQQESVKTVLDTIYNPPIKNLFVLCQNRITGQLDDIIFDTNYWKKHGVALEGHRKPGENHAAIYSYKEKDYQAERLEEDDLQSFSKKDRLMVYIVTQNDKNILLASYHGPYVKETDEEKLLIVRDLVTFLEKVRNDRDCCVAILGGTFNIKAAKVKASDMPQPTEVLYSYIQPEDRKEAPYSDYVIRWPPENDDFQEIETTVILREYQRQRGERPFAHPLVLYRFGNRFEEERQRQLKMVNSTEDVEFGDTVPSFGSDKIKEAKQRYEHDEAEFTFTSVQTGITEREVDTVKERLQENSNYKIFATAIVHVPDPDSLTTEQIKVSDTNVPDFSRNTKSEKIVEFDKFLRSNYGEQNEVVFVYGLFRNT